MTDTTITETLTDAAAAEAPKLELVDIENAIKVIDYAAEQGAYKGWGVIDQVLQVRNRLATFLAAVKPPEAEATEEVEATTAE